MTNRKIFHGVSQGQEVSRARANRDIRSMFARIRDSAAYNGKTQLYIAAIVAFFWPLIIFVASRSSPTLSTQLSDWLAIVATIWFLFSRSSAKRISTNHILSPPIDAPGTSLKDAGIFCIGNEFNTRSEVWIEKDIATTHFLVFGSTGSGKTRYLLGLVYQSLAQGSGCMYVDGKADNTVFWLFYSICARLDRLSDLLVINYLNSNLDSILSTGARHSNTTNPLAFGDAVQIRSLLTGLMRDSKGDGDTWKGMAVQYMGALLKILVWKRNAGLCILTFDLILESLQLKNTYLLATDDRVPKEIRGPLMNYLHNLPGFTFEDAEADDIDLKANEQHGYRSMQFLEVLNDLNDSYGYIFGVKLGDVNFKDIILNRRILFVMLPSLDKDPDALAGLGKLIVSGIRSALGPALGNLLEGTYAATQLKKASKSNTPFTIILDEYGYYTVKGFAVVAAQARSLNVSVVFASQDYPSLKKSDENEAASTVANTNVKLCFKLEDAEDTLKVFVARAGKARVSQTSGYERKGFFDTYKDDGRSSLVEVDRIDVRDLVDQGKGECHMLFADRIIRIQSLYVDPVEAPAACLSRYIEVLPPSAEKIDQYKRERSEVRAAPRAMSRVKSFGLTTDTVVSVAPAMDLFTALLTKDVKSAQAMRFAVDRFFNPPLHEATSDSDVEVVDSDTQVPPTSTGDVAPRQQDLPVHHFGGSEVAMPEPQSNAWRPTTANREFVERAGAAEKAFIGVLRDVVIKNLESRLERPLTDDEMRAADPFTQLVDFEILDGQSVEDAERTAVLVAERVSKVVEYLPPPPPTKMSPSTLSENLRQTLEALKGKLSEETTED